jgi:hypothetical protein
MSEQTTAKQATRNQINAGLLVLGQMEGKQFNAELRNILSAMNERMDEMTSEITKTVHKPEESRPRQYLRSETIPPGQPSAAKTPKFHPDQKCDRCPSLGAYDLTTTMLCLPCWQAASKEVLDNLRVPIIYLDTTIAKKPSNLSIWLKNKAEMEGRSAKEWREQGNAEQATYRSGMQAVCLELMDLISRGQVF